MTRFYWLDNETEAENDAVLKGYDDSEWIFCADKESLLDIDVEQYEGVYLQRGVRELEEEFARIMRRDAPAWLC